jgi:coenzyme F420-dependent glucose-6-phosphate dehydrogenase
MEDPRKMELLTDTLPIERVASRWIVTNDPEELIEKTEPCLELGFKHLFFHAPAPGPDRERFLRLFSEDALPGSRRRFS